MTNISPLSQAKDRRPEDALKLLESLCELAKTGRLKQISVVYDTGDTWATASSHSFDKRVTGAMLIELGLRNLGFSVNDD